MLGLLLLLALAACSDDSSGSASPDTEDLGSDSAADSEADSGGDTEADSGGEDIDVDAPADLGSDTGDDSSDATDDTSGDDTDSSEDSADAADDGATDAVDDATDASDDTDAADTGDDGGEPGPGSIAVSVTDADGNAIAGVQATLDGTTALPNEDDDLMRFEELDAGEYVVKIEAPDYPPATTIVSVAEGEQSVAAVILAAVDWRGVYDTDTAATLGIEGARVTLETDAVDGGDALLDVTVVNPSTDERYAAPGPPLGRPTASEDLVAITPLAMVDFRFTRDGESVGLADGASATIELLIPSELTDGLSLGQEVPAWYFDPETGVWQADGLGTIVDAGDAGLAWRATVDHFTWWMPGFIDTRPTSCVVVHVHRAGEPERGLFARVTLSATDGSYWSRNWTNTGGNHCFDVPDNLEVTVIAENGIYPSQVGGPTTVTTPGGEDSCLVIGSRDCFDVDIAMAGTHCARGTVTRDEDPVAGAFVSARWDSGAGPRARFDRAGEEGEFCFALVRSATVRVGAGDDRHHIVALREVETGGEELACVDGICTVVDLELPEEPETIDCIVGRAFIDDRGSYSGLLPPVPLGAPIYFYDDEPGDIDVPCSCDTQHVNPGDYGTFELGATHDGLGHFCVELSSRSSTADIYPVIGDCDAFDSCQADPTCPYGYYHPDFVDPSGPFPEGPDYVLGTCGTGLCLNLGAIGGFATCGGPPH